MARSVRQPDPALEVESCGGASDSFALRPVNDTLLPPRPIGDSTALIMRLVLFEPDIPQNTGTMMRLCACLGVAIDVIEPCGFVFDDRRMRRAGMDYLDGADLTRHRSWAAYQATAHQGRLVLLSTAAEQSYLDHAFHPDDRVMVGRETGGVPPDVAEAADVALRIPMQLGRRSLNVAIAAAMALGEGLRQTQAFTRGLDR